MLEAWISLSRESGFIEINSFTYTCPSPVPHPHLTYHSSPLRSYANCDLLKNPLMSSNGKFTDWKILLI
ncbi:hypothetical protein E2C01_064663 [Portunus trituberculatus]|uniref:Uncharacterized protein n=1 Tax=Portunus trituberculatus TaxID=210409 RepID=A0A5B7HPD9_PORTR|nr:hypothetical protein [Portunus trituberculatus]